MTNIRDIEDEYRCLWLDANWDLGLTDASSMLTTLSALGFLDYETDHSIAFFEHYALDEGRIWFHELSCFLFLAKCWLTDNGLTYLYEETESFREKSGLILSLPDCFYCQDNYVCKVDTQTYILWTYNEVQQIPTGAGRDDMEFPRYCQLFNEILKINHSHYRLYYAMQLDSFATCMLLTRPVFDYLSSIGVIKK